MKKKQLIGLVVMIAFASVLFLNFGSSVGGYMDFGEAATTGSEAHVVGQWAADLPAEYNPDHNVFRFHMRDEHGDVREVHYTNPKPANFEDAEKLVIQGKMDGDVFMAHHILVKCPSKYNDTRGLEAALPAS